MNKPSTYARDNVNQLWLELTALFALTTVAVAHLFDLHWSMAMGTAPLFMLAMLVGVAFLVEVLWLFVTGIDRVGQALGVRKSPLA